MTKIIYVPSGITLTFQVGASQSFSDQFETSSSYTVMNETPRTFINRLVNRYALSPFKERNGIPYAIELLTEEFEILYD